ncbi:uncharacterized protein LOC121906603 [Xyrichtys novacula]|uniref:Uncharacterized protein LOC121906603 n=1 Tax=Xyrichtys novacula TaxID=13765 RepID=A0AAV1HMW2_XYRNO|nr:uncharacterized protein LOC121906603 [Xyrichtys novacula]
MLGNGDGQPQDGDIAHDSGKEKEKRVVKHTAKGLELLVENCQKPRGSCVKKAVKLRETLKELMKDNENANAVKCHFEQLIDLCGESRKCHSSLIVLPLPEEEIQRQNKWFLPKIDKLECFIQDVQVWLSELKPQTSHVTENEPQIHVTVETEPEMELQMHVTDESEKLSVVHNDEIGPQDSASNVTKTMRKSTTSRACTTSSVRIRAQAEKAAPMEQVAALHKIHEMEKQQERLKFNRKS